MVENNENANRGDQSATLSSELVASGWIGLEEVGHGRCGTVFRCRRPSSSELVAVKALRVAPDEGYWKNFARRLRESPHQTDNVIDFPEFTRTSAGRPLMVMPYYSQGNLAARISQFGPLSVGDVIRLGVRMASALSVIHQNGFTHGNIRPTNIFYPDRGEPILSDFAEKQVSLDFELMTSPTASDSLYFTAPELIGRAHVASASDVYGLGATLLYALLGDNFFKLRRGELHARHLVSAIPPPASDGDEINGAERDLLVKVLSAAMASDPCNRPTMRVLGDQLGQIRQLAGVLVMPREDPDPPVEQGATPHLLGGRGEGVVLSKVTLPAEMTSFVGRRKELAQVRTALSSCRLVTLTGIGGVGKTRLAIRAASSRERDHPDGIWLVELADVRDPGLVVELVDAALGVRNYAGKQLADVLIEALSSRNALLIFDTCEHLIESVAGLVKLLLQKCPNLRILATSREALGVHGELVVKVPPLSAPRVYRGASLRSYSRCDSVALFTERAAEVVHGFELTASNMTAVARICEGLEGLPLAIELAAARMATLTAEQIAHRLANRYALLSRGSRGRPARQQKLRWSIAWSYDLCTDAEQQLWAQLSVFVGSFDLAAVEAVCEIEGDSALLDTLSGLVDKSIVAREEPSDGGHLRMLETLRDLGSEKMKRKGGYRQLRRRHRDWYERLIWDAQADWISSRQVLWMRYLTRELPNLRAAFEFSLSEDDDSALKISASLYPFWLSQGKFTEGRRWLDRALARSSASPTPTRAEALCAAGILAGEQGDVAVARKHVRTAILIDKKVSSPEIRAQVAIADSFVALCSSDPDGAEARLEGVTTGNDAYALPMNLLIEAMLILGWVHLTRGQLRRAVEYHSRALAISENCGEVVHRGPALWGVAISQWLQGEVEGATKNLESGLRIADRTGDPLMIFLFLQALAWIFAEGGDPDRAAVIMGAAEAHRCLAGSAPVFIPNLISYQIQSERTIRERLGEAKFAARLREGRAMSPDAAIGFALRVRPRRKLPVAQKSDDLTKRELEIARLVADGLTNQAIAARLMISRRTVEGHVEHILIKLGFTSRSQVAVWVTAP
ncbi:LuxR C-terminal-related transcriptional regulator [Rhodococcus sp. BH2-1]|nr:LuxR C-terminal-related transcriptional regulator [Rhodococcus sp. BH2-1]